MSYFDIKNQFKIIVEILAENNNVNRVSGLLSFSVGVSREKARLVQWLSFFSSDL